MHKVCFLTDVYIHMFCYYYSNHVHNLSVLHIHKTCQSDFTIYCCVLVFAKTVHVAFLAFMMCLSPAGGDDGNVGRCEW